MKIELISLLPSPIMQDVPLLASASLFRFLLLRQMRGCISPNYVNSTMREIKAKETKRESKF